MNGVFVTVYGPAKTGKSVCTGAAGASGLFIAQAGGLLPLKNFLGLDGVKVAEAHSIEAAAKIVEAEAGKHATIVMDDFSILVEQTIAQLEQVHSFGEMWRALRHQVLKMRDAARKGTEKGTHVIFNCHESPPKTSSGKFVRGGPSLPGQLPEQFSAFSDVVARVVYEETAKPWSFVLHTVSDAQYIAGDRLSVFPANAPMNLAEAMRLAGYDIPRPKDLEWQTSVVEKLSKAVLESGIETWRDTLQKASLPLRKKYPIPHVRWALQDALHRAVLTNARENMIDELFIESNGGW